MGFIGWPELVLILGIIAVIILLFFIYRVYNLFSGLIEKKARKIVKEELEKERETSGSS